MHRAAYLKAYRKSTEVVERNRQRVRDYIRRPEVRQHRRDYAKAYSRRPEGKARINARNRARYDKVGRGYRRNLGCLVEAQGGLCGICDKALPNTLRYVHVDHIVPTSLGGGSEIENLQAVHGRCNHAKHNNIGDGVAPKLT